MRRNMMLILLLAALANMASGQWQANGTAICTATNAQSWPTIASDGAGGAFIAWQDYRNGNYDIYAQRVDSLGHILWNLNGVPVCTTAGSQSSQLLIGDGHGGAIIIWSDYRSGGAIFTSRG